MKVLQISTTANSGSTGRIAEEIGKTVLKNKEDSYIAFSRSGLPTTSIPVKIGNKLDVYTHVLYSRLLDRHGFASKKSTFRFVEEVQIIEPDIIHLHNIHGYYLNIKMLFQFLKKYNKPIVWTFHDCWPFTGHCTFFDSVNCEKWKKACYDCPKIKMYPKSWFIDNSAKNYIEKKNLFQGLSNLQIITPSQWLKNHVHVSFLKEYPVSVINNGIDLNVFKPEGKLSAKQLLAIENKKVVLGVANIWDSRKGLSDFIELSKKLDSSYQIVLIGLNKKQIKELPKNIMGISRTENTAALAAWYAAAEVFVNPTYQDNFPTTNLEALACGTPVITYNTGGSPEAIDEFTGKVVTKGNIDALANGISEIVKKGKSCFSLNCRVRAEKLFDKDKRYQDYIALYHKILA